MIKYLLFFVNAIIIVKKNIDRQENEEKIFQKFGESRRITKNILMGKIVAHFHCRINFWFVVTGGFRFLQPHYLYTSRTIHVRKMKRRFLMKAYFIKPKNL